jgi:hypothetical protein
VPGDHHAGGPPAGGAPSQAPAEEVIVPATGAQAAYLAVLRRRAAACRDGLVPVSADNMISVLSDERLASLDLRLTGQPMDGPGKIAAAAGRIAGLAAGRRGLQVVFCELGYYRAQHASLPDGTRRSWNIDFGLAGELEARGVPSRFIRIASARELSRGAAELAEECRARRVRVLLTDTYGPDLMPAIAGLVTAAHHLDVPFDAHDAWRRVLALAREGAPAPPQLRYLTSGYTDQAAWLAADAGQGPVAAAQAALDGAPAAAARAARRHRPGPAPRGPRRG